MKRVYVRLHDGTRREHHYLSRVPTIGETVAGLLPNSGHGYATWKFNVKAVAHFANVYEESPGMAVDAECIGEFFPGEETTGK